MIPLAKEKTVITCPETIKALKEAEKRGEKKTLIGIYTEPKRKNTELGMVPTLSLEDLQVEQRIRTDFGWAVNKSGKFKAHSKEQRPFEYVLA